MLTPVILPGRELSLDTEEAKIANLRQILNVKVRVASEFDSSIRGAAEIKTGPVDADDSDVVEIEYEDGTVQWATVREIRQQTKIGRAHV